MLEAYAEGMQWDGQLETNAVKQARIVPTKLDYKNWSEKFSHMYTKRRLVYVQVVYQIDWDIMLQK